MSMELYGKEGESMTYVKKSQLKEFIRMDDTASLKGRVTGGGLVSGGGE